MIRGIRLQKAAVLDVFQLVLIILTAVSCGSSDSSTPAAGAVTVVVAPPLAPAGLVASAQDGYNNLSWSASGGASTYNVYWATSSGVNRATANKFSVSATSTPHGGIINSTAYYYVVSAQNAGGESPASSETSATPLNGAGAADTLYANQWHLKNNINAGEDINVEPVWACAPVNSCRGEGIRIAVVDNGLEIAHEDLVANVASGMSFNYVDGSNDPSTGDHGTCVAGIIAARDLNGLGTRGVAPRANIVGYNMIQNSTTSNMGDAMVRGGSSISVSSNSWGYPDGLGLLDSPPIEWTTAIETGLSSGRNGLGTNYVFAAGNGAQGQGSDWCVGASPPCYDNSNYDGVANYHGVIAVGSVNKAGLKSTYSEQGANLWISAPGGEFCNGGLGTQGGQAITTTDRAGGNGFNPTLYPGFDYANLSYTKCMNGTSAATPAVSGVIALMLQAKSSLSWRDVRLILANTARKNNPGDAGWASNAAGYHINHKYGFGMVDASAAVTAAATWTPVVAQVIYTSPTRSPNLVIPTNDMVTGVTDTMTISGSGITNIEWVEITFTAADHTYSGALQVTLSKTTGGVTQSILSDVHSCDSNTCVAYSGWVFGTGRHLGEPANGNWTLTVKDGRASDTGHLQSWKMKFYGT